MRLVKKCMRWIVIRTKEKSIITREMLTCHREEAKHHFPGHYRYTTMLFKNTRYIILSGKVEK